jgi:hypothetical protein
VEDPGHKCPLSKFGFAETSFTLRILSRSTFIHRREAKIQYSDILKRLKSLSSPRAIEGMAKYGITPERTYGVSIPKLRRYYRSML